MTYRTSLPLYQTELGCPPNCNKTVKKKRKEQKKKLKKCGKKPLGSCKVTNRRRRKY
tara:strand:+ start:442 stop:612 length:171 start_codon:yes stop_codon:yes gene_type:complete